jgi:transcriptional regulator with XRE-family HTH domain
MIQPKQSLADLLGDLKKRSGYSFETLGRKTNLSRSSVHRYCNGSIVPPEFGLIERIAKVCGADRAELRDLYRRWARAVEEGEGVIITTAEVAGTPTASTGKAAALPPTDRHRPVPHRRRAAARLVLTALLLSILVVTPASSLTFTSTGSSGPPPPTTGQLVLPQPAWAETPTPVPRGLFGVTVNSSTGAMPTFDVGTVRFWDSHTRWANIEPRRGEYDWSVLDRLVAGAARMGVPSLFTLGGTPDWASPTGPHSPYDDDSRTSPPTDLTDWTDFVRAVVRHYHGGIAAYELWVMANDPHFYSGSVETLVDMTRRAWSVIKSEDPRATIVCPSMGQLWDPGAQQVLGRFAALGGYDYCDAAGVKLYQRSATDPPESMLALAGEIDHAFHRAGVHPPIWNTGTSYDIPLQQPLDPGTAADHAARFYLVGLWAHYERMYFYSWGSTKVPLVLQADGGAPTTAALYVQELGRWLREALIRSCEQGAAVGLPTNVFQCRFSHSGGDFLIRWTDAGSARMPVEPGVRTVRRLDGSTNRVAPGDTLDIDTRPAMLSLTTGS